MLVSIALDASGEFAVRSAKRANGVADYAWQLNAMTGELAPHQPPAEATTPFDMTLDRDTMIVYRLEPGAWEWESDPAKAIFLKDAEPHDPFSVAENPPGLPRLLAVRFHAPATLGGCAWDYNLGVVVNHGGRRTPLVVDPQIKNGGGVPPQARALVLLPMGEGGAQRRMRVPPSTIGRKPRARDPHPEFACANSDLSQRER